MPEAFDKCVKGGGRVRTISGSSAKGKQMGLGKNEYRHVCFNKSGSHLGYVKTNKTAEEIEKGPSK